MNLKTVFKKIKQTRLSASARAAMRRDVVAHMQAHPLHERNDARIRHTGQTEGSLLPHYFFSIPYMRKHVAVFSLAAVVLAASGGTALAAEQSLPGEALYPVKFHFNENVRGAAALSAEAKAEWNTRRAERRFDEFRVLVKDGQLSEDASGMMAEHLADHIARIEEGIAKMTENGNTEAAAKMQTKLEAMLAVQEQVLADVAADGTVNVETMKAMHEEVKAGLGRHATLRKKILHRVGEDVKEAKQEGRAFAPHMMGGAHLGLEQKIEATGKLLTQFGADIDATVKTQVETHVATAEEKFDESKAAREEGNDEDAFAAFHEGMLEVQEAHQLLMQSRKDAGFALKLKRSELRGEGQGKMIFKTKVEEDQEEGAPDEPAEEKTEIEDEAAEESGA